MIPDVAGDQKSLAPDFVYQEVYKAFQDAEEILETLRSNVGRRGYSILHEAVDLSKEGIEAVFQGDDFAIAECDGKLRDLWNKFLEGRISGYLSKQLSPDFNHDIPGFKREEFLHEIAQEIVEFKMVAHIWPVIVGKETEFTLPSPKDCRVPIQSWFGAAIDTISETAKLLGRVLNGKLTLDERIEWRERYLSVARQLAQRLHDVAHAPGDVINNSTRRGQGFHNALGRVDRLIGAIGVANVELLDRKAANDDMR